MTYIIQLLINMVIFKKSMNINMFHQVNYLSLKLFSQVLLIFSDPFLCHLSQNRNKNKQTKPQKAKNFQT